MIPEARNQSGVSMPVDVEDMQTAAAMLAAGGLKPQDISVALRIDVGQVRAWLLPPAHTVPGALRHKPPISSDQSGLLMPQPRTAKAWSVVGAQLDLITVEP